MRARRAIPPAILIGVTDTSRRDFLRALGRRAARDARDVAQVAGPVLRVTSPLGTVAALRALAGPADELGRLVRAEGLGSRLAEIQALAQVSVRMTPVADDASRAGAWVDLVGGEALLYPDSPTMLLAQVSLASPALEGTWLHGDGWLVVFVDGAGTASVVRLDDPAALPPTVDPMTLAPQLVLPDVDDEPVYALGLSDQDRAAYGRVRDALAGDIDHALLGFGETPVEDLGDGDWQLLLQARVCPTEHVSVWVADRDLGRAVATIS
jgi:hypothetical protein